jgi:hypothetical protein
MKDYFSRVNWRTVLFPKTKGSNQAVSAGRNRVFCQAETAWLPFCVAWANFLRGWFLKIIQYGHKKQTPA